MKTIKKLALFYLKFIAKLQLAKFRPTIVGIGGASGKTSLSNFVSIILREKYKILDSKGKNSQTGIPLSIFKIKMGEYTLFYWTKVFFLATFRLIFDWKRFDVFIAELGIDGPYEPMNMSYLLKIIKPHIGVLTNIALEHSQYFEEILSKDQKNKSQKILDLTSNQEALLLESLPKNGLAVLNLDDEKIKNLKGIKADILTVSSKDKIADFYIENIETTISSFTVKFLSKGGRYQIEVKNPLPSHYANSFLLAIAVCSRFNFKIDESIKILEEKFSLPPGRITLFDGKKGTTIIDSSYNNATLAPILDLLDLLKLIAKKRRKVAILGDMRELGSISSEYHKKVANKILETTDFVILIGPMMRKFVSPMLQKHNHKFYSFETFTQAKETILNSLQSKDIILVKGSQNTLFLERAVEMLLKDKNDTKKLCRRGNYWDKIRRQTL